MNTLTKIFTLFTIFSVVLVMASSPAYAVCSNNENGEAGVEGEVEYFSDNVLRYCDDTNWVDMRPADNDIANAVAFDGVNDYLSTTSALTGATDSKQITGSFWVNPDVDSNFENIAHLSNGHFRVLKGSSGNIIRIRADNAAGTEIMDIRAGSLSINSWTHVIFSFDLTDTGKRHIYFNDVDQSLTVGTYTNDDIDFTAAGNYVGSNDAGSSVYDGDIADLWIDFGTYIDLSVEDNRRKFISNTGQPVYLGETGLRPTGSVPEFFLSGATNNWHINKGTGGGFIDNDGITTA